MFAYPILLFHSYNGKLDIDSVGGSQIYMKYDDFLSSIKDLLDILLNSSYTFDVSFGSFFDYLDLLCTYYLSEIQ